MGDFSVNINNFQKYGTYQYKFDSNGNLIFNSSSADFSQVYLSFPLNNIIYNNEKIGSFYNIEFEEFIPIQSSITSSAIDIISIQNELQTIQLENDTLKEQLNSYITQSQDTVGGIDNQLIKDVILELRKSLGQGRVDSDFSEVFPYAPSKQL